MKQVLLIATCFFISSMAIGQCVPMADFGDAPFGIEPDTIVNLLPGEVDVLYVQQIDVKVPVDGAFADLPFIAVDSASIASINGMPPGLSIECAGNAFEACTYLGGTIGCAVISGIPESGGTFDLEIQLLVHTDGFGSIPFLFEGYTIVIDGPVGIEETFAIQSLSIQPNPANDLVRFNANTIKSGIGVLQIFDLVGKEVHQQSLQLAIGGNQINYNSSLLPEGVYICRFDAFGETQTRRLVIVH